MALNFLNDNIAVEVEKLCHKCKDLNETLHLNNTFEELKHGEGKEYTYNSLVFCLIDAVFSIGVNYKSVENTVKKYAKYYNLDLFEANEFDKHTINDFITNYENFNKMECSCNCELSFAKCVLQNLQRTSSKSGILKADACMKVAKKLRENNIFTIKDFREKNDDELNKIDDVIRNGVPGQSSGIMFSYLRMLAGDDNYCKPDRWIIRFLEENGLSDISKDNILIQKLFYDTCTKLREEGYIHLTPRYLDYQIWSYQRSKETPKKSKKKLKKG